MEGGKKRREEFRELFTKHNPGKELVSFDPDGLRPTSKSGTVSIPLTWDHPSSDPLRDLAEAYSMTGWGGYDSLGKLPKPVGELEYYISQEVARYPILKHCSMCGTERTKQIDPPITLKHCPNCGHVDPVPNLTSLPAPTTISWPEVQRLLIGILRQVEDNKVQIHPAEFDLTGITFYQETNPDTGIVSIWFEKAEEQKHCESSIVIAVRHSFKMEFDNVTLHCIKGFEHTDPHCASNPINPSALYYWPA